MSNSDSFDTSLVLVEFSDINQSSGMFNKVACVFKTEMACVNKQNGLYGRIITLHYSQHHPSHHLQEPTIQY